MEPVRWSRGRAGGPDVTGELFKCYQKYHALDAFDICVIDYTVYLTTFDDRAFTLSLYYKFGLIYVS